MQGKHNQRRPADTTIMITLLVVRLAFLLFNPAGLSGDAFGYVEAAQTIIDTGRLPPLGAWPRGYPMLIAPLLFVSGDGLARGVLVMNSIMDCGVVAMLFCSASYSWSDSRKQDGEHN